MKPGTVVTVSCNLDAITAPERIRTPPLGGATPMPVRAGAETALCVQVPQWGKSKGGGGINNSRRGRQQRRRKSGRN